ncbi:hypothetical protein, partial [Fusobacterium nucleatum]|uniref:hypothetical protein n=1 Tax=Fusobacterium nucleatum TaxID=851 RepID=UPI001EED1D69
MYQPLPVPSTVITPLGRYSIPKLELEMQQNGFESMRNRFFIFNHFIKTADVNCTQNLGHKIGGAVFLS